MRHWDIFCRQQIWEMRHFEMQKKEQTMLALVRDEAGHEDVGYFL